MKLQKLGGKTSTIKQLRDAYVFFKEGMNKLFNNTNVADESKFSHFIEAGKGSVRVALESHFGNLDEKKNLQSGFTTTNLGWLFMSGRFLQFLMMKMLKQHF